MKALGYTLIELMITAVIVILIGAVSMGYYGEHVKSGDRSEAKSALMQLQNAMEQFKTENNTYDGTHSNGKPLASFFPSTAPIGSPKARYNLVIDSATEATYELRATPISGERMEGDGDFTLSHTGAKTYKGEKGWN